MRKTQFGTGEYYHVCGRGNGKQELFLDIRDYIRFLLLVLYFQSPVIINNPSYYVANFLKHKIFKISKKTEQKILQTRSINLVAFSFMPNHFHIIVQETGEGGISRYMQKILMAYAKYFNAKYKKSGHVFQGPFQAVHIKNNEQFLYVSAYVHLNQRELHKWTNRESTYPWSSFQDYVEKNRWGKLLVTDEILAQFKNPEEYKKEVEESGAK